MKIIWLSKLFCVIVMSAFSATTIANDEFFSPDLPDAAGDTAAFHEQDLLFQDIPSVYTASKYEQKVTKAPASVSIITADEIKKWGYRTFGEVLNSLKGFYNTNDRNYGYAGARGFGIPSDYNTHLLLLIDGHRFNDNIFEAFDTSSNFPVDIDNIERVEIVRGPSSSIYGSSAFFGVINVITKRGRDVQGINIKGSYGSNTAYKTTASFGKRFSNGIETFISGTFYRSQGFDRLYYPEFDTPETNNGWSVDHDGEQTRQLLAKTSLGNFTFAGLHTDRRKAVPTASFATLFNDSGYYTYNESNFLDLKYEHTFANQVTLEARLSYNNSRFHSDYPYHYGEGDMVDKVINKDLAYGQWWRAEFEGSALLWQGHHVTLGGQWQQNFQQFQTNYDIETYIDSNAHTYQGAIFIQDDYQFNEQLNLNAGVRLDYYSIFGATVNPRVGLIYTPWQASTVKLLYGSAFRAPSQYELNYHGSTDTIQFLQPNLKPEMLETTELILEHYFSSQLRLEFNLFHSDISDLIALIDTEGGQLCQTNLNHVDSHGIEIQLEYNAFNSWQTRLSYSWQETHDKHSQERLSNSPEHLLKFNLIAPLWREKVFLGFETQVMSMRKTDKNSTVPGFVLSNLTLFTKPLKGLELSGGIYNLFDQRYFDPGSDAHAQYGIQQDPLTFRLRASWDF